MKKNAVRIMGISGVVLLGTLLWSGLGYAQNVKQKIDNVPSSVINLEGTVIEGKIQRPQAVYIIAKSGLNYTSFRLKKSFVKDIVDSVKQDKF